jgi:hypothetical protein
MNRPDSSLESAKARVAQLEQENEQLRHALTSRRLDLPPKAVFELIRSAARRAGMKLPVLAEEILKSRVTPALIDREIAHLRSKPANLTPS